MLKRAIGSFAAVTLAALMAATTAGGANAAVRTEHPRIWLTPEFKQTVVARYARNTYNASYLRSWCDNHINDELQGGDSRAISVLKSINYALMYQLTGTTSYATHAVAMVEYALAHPYTGYTTDTWIEFDNYYTDRYLVPPVAIVLDWCYPVMTQPQRDAFVAQLDRWAANIMSSEPWAWCDPSNNYYYGHLWAILTAGYAIYGHNANAQSYIDYARGTMLAEGIKYTRGEQVLWETLGNRTGRANGGMWNEGTSYGSVNNEFICSAVLAAMSAEGLSYPEFTFGNDAVLFYIYATYPSGDHTYAEGDGASRGDLGPTTRVPLLFATACATGDVKRYGQHWINSFTENATSDYKLYNEFLWYDDQLSPIDYSTVLPDHYYLEGTKMMFWRSGWGANDCWMNLKIGLLNSDHAQNGLGNFIIYQRGYLATCKSYETQNSELASDNDHSVLFVQPYEDKKLYWGASVITHREVTDDFLYFAGDMTGVYTAQPDYRRNTVQHKDREFFLLKGEKVLAIMDRGTSFDVNVDKIWQVYLHNQATSSGSAYRSSNGNADLVIKTAYPTTAAASFDVSGAPRMRVTTSTAAASKQFLHLLKVTSPGGAFQTASVAVSGATVVAAAFSAAADTLDYLLAFSSEAGGNPPTATSYTLTFTRFHNEIAGYVMDCAPSTTYYLASAKNGDAVTFTVSRSQIAGGTQLSSDAQGLLAFRLNLGGGQPQQPLQPPPGPYTIEEEMH